MLKTTISNMLSYLDSQKPSSRSKGVALANKLKNGFESVQINTGANTAADGGDESYHYGRQITSTSSKRNTVVYNVHKGAVTVDARNKTVAEAQTIITLALEGLKSNQII